MESQPQKGQKTANRFALRFQPSHSRVVRDFADDYSLTRSDYFVAKMSAILNLTEAKAKFSEVVERASRGEEIIVTRMGHPVARITGTSQGPRTVAWGSSRAESASPRTSMSGQRTSPAISG